MRRMLPLLALVLGACGYTDAGSGSGTLKVTAKAGYSVGGDDKTSIQIDVSKPSTNTDPVMDAVVYAKDGDTGEQIPVPYDATHGDYRTDVDKYRRRLEIKMQSGNDGLDVKLEGPGPHTITSPEAGALNRGGDTLGVTWATSDGVAADTVILRIPEVHVETVLSTDTGSSHDIPWADLPTGSYHLSVTRLNHVIPNGGAPDSSFEIAYEVTTAFSVN